MTSRASTARELRNLAGNPTLATNAPWLRSLADAVELKKDMHCWSPESIALLATSGQLSSDSGSKNWFSLVGALSGVSVFFPIAWAWWSLHKATDAYAQVVAAGDTPARLTFLGFWGSGFEGHLQEAYWLPNVAETTFVLIGIAVLLILLTFLFESLQRRRDVRENELLRSLIIPALARASAFVRVGASDSLEGVELVIANSINALAESHRLTQVASENLDRSARLVGRTTKTGAASLERILSQTNAVADRQEAAAAALAETLQDTSHSSADLLESIRQTEAETITNTKTLSNASERLGDLVASLSTNLPASLEAFHVRSIASENEQREQLVTGLRESSGEIALTVEELKRLLESQLDLLGETIALGANATQAHTNQLDGVATIIAKLLTEMRSRDKV